MQIAPPTKESTLKKIFVLGGTQVVTEVPSKLVTILGSCVSVCLWDEKLKIGGMNHYLLPETVNDAKSLNGGIGSTQILIQTMIRKGASVNNMKARIFGGA